MRKIPGFILFLLCLMSASGAATVQSNATQTSAFNYNYMYPYMNNQMRNELNPGTYTELNTNPIDAVVRTTKIPTPARTVRARPSASQVNSARAAVSQAASAQTSARRSVRARSASGVAQTSAPGTNARRGVRPRATRQDTNPVVRSAPNTTTTLYTGTQVSASRCMADYTECMNNYCVRENTQYNRCYCSAKLSQIDAKYQNDIDNLIKQIIKMRNTNQWTDAEMNEYWMGIMGKYVTENSWVKIDEALNIDWAGTESRVRGQQAFATGHEYCVQHLQGCYYTASNLRDAYRSEIARDCAVYEENLQKIKMAAESLIEAGK